MHTTEANRSPLTGPDPTRPGHQVTLRLLRGAGDPLSGALVFAGQPRSMAALAYALDPSSLVTPVGPEGSATMEALADGLDEARSAVALLTCGTINRTCT